MKRIVVVLFNVAVLILLSSSSFPEKRTGNQESNLTFESKETAKTCEYCFYLRFSVGLKKIYLSNVYSKYPGDYTDGQKCYKSRQQASDIRKDKIEEYKEKEYKIDYKEKRDDSRCD